MGAEAPLTPEAAAADRGGTRSSLRHNLLVLAGRGATGLLPLLITVIASRSYDVALMGEIVTAVAVAYAIAEVADGQSQRHVTRVLANAGSAGHERTLAAFNTLRFIMLGLGVIGALALPFLRQPVLWALVATALWGTLSNMAYARALADGRYDLLGVCPFVPLVTLLAAATIASRTPWADSPWALVLGLHAARAAEAGVLALATPWPGLTASTAALRDQWTRTRYLLLQTAMSAAHVRLLMPLILVSAGAAAAGVFSIGVTLLSVLSLVAVAVTIPAYRQSANAGSKSIAVMLRRTRVDLIAGIAVCAALGLVLALATPVLLRTLFHVADSGAADVVRIVTLGGLFEAPALLASVYYQASFRDRQLFGLSVVNVVTGWVVLVVGLWFGGLTGGAWGFLASRALSAVILWIPLLAGQRE
jgi:O-antigen/teichoic acid export membrane protein